MANHVDVFIENYHQQQVITGKEGYCLIISSLFGAYRAAGKTEEEAFAAANSDLKWIISRLKKNQKQFGESDGENLPLKDAQS